MKWLKPVGTGSIPMITQARTVPKWNNPTNTKIKQNKNKNWSPDKEPKRCEYVSMDKEWAGSQFPVRHVISGERSKPAHPHSELNLNCTPNVPISLHIYMSVNHYSEFSCHMRGQILVCDHSENCSSPSLLL